MPFRRCFVEGSCSWRQSWCCPVDFERCYCWIYDLDVYLLHLPQRTTDSFVHLSHCLSFMYVKLFLIVASGCVAAQSNTKKSTLQWYTPTQASRKTMSSERSRQTSYHGTPFPLRTLLTGRGVHVEGLRSPRSISPLDYLVALQSVAFLER